MNQPFLVEKEKLPMVVNKNSVQKSGRQHKSFLFCPECEERFEKRETVVAGIIDKMQAMSAEEKIEKLSYVDNSVFLGLKGNIGVESIRRIKNVSCFSENQIEAIKYFVVSLIFRNVVHEGVDVGKGFYKSGSEDSVGKDKKYQCYGCCRGEYFKLISCCNDRCCKKISRCHRVQVNRARISF